MWLHSVLVGLTSSTHKTGLPCLATGPTINMIAAGSQSCNLQGQCCKLWAFMLYQVTSQTLTTWQSRLMSCTHMWMCVDTCEYMFVCKCTHETTANAASYRELGCYRPSEPQTLCCVDEGQGLTVKCSVGIDAIIRHELVWWVDQQGCQ